MIFSINEDPLLPPSNSKKRNLGERSPVLSPIFVFWKWAIQRGSILHWKRFLPRQNGPF